MALPWPRFELCCSLAVHSGQVPLELAEAPFIWFGLLKGTSKVTFSFWARGF